MSARDSLISGRHLPGEVHERPAGGEHAEAGADVEDRERHVHARLYPEPPRRAKAAPRRIRTVTTLAGLSLAADGLRLQRSNSASVIAPAALSSVSFAIWSAGETCGGGLRAASMRVRSSTSCAVTFGRAIR